MSPEIKRLRQPPYALDFVLSSTPDLFIHSKVLSLTLSIHADLYTERPFYRPPPTTLTPRLCFLLHTSSLDLFHSLYTQYNFVDTYTEYSLSQASQYQCYQQYFLYRITLPPSLPKYSVETLSFCLSSHRDIIFFLGLAISTNSTIDQFLIRILFL